MNLKPDYEKNIALCRQCGVVFQGIPATDAIYTTDEEEIKLQRKCEDDNYVFDAIVTLNNLVNKIK